MTNEKKPYEKPEIRSESTLETTTLACGKCITGPTGAGTPACKAVKKTS
ncbi:MAG: hypothetical protein HY922_08515 [Elusimicrobia bacterium]|nr:hypothetical protein [Elusimicrobiota bacterium]